MPKYIQKCAHSWALISSCSWPTLSHLRSTKSTTAAKALFLPPAWSNILRWVVGHIMWNDVDLNRLFFSFLGGGGLFWWQNGKHFCRQEKFLVRSFPNVKYFCERKKENNRDNPSTFQCTITFTYFHALTSFVSCFTWQLREFVEIEIGLQYLVSVI